jgi:cellulose synthase operon protein C
MSHPHRFRLHALGVAIALSLAGCASNKAVDDQTLRQQARYSGTTLADLEKTDITIEAQDLENVSAQAALQSYQRAVELFQDPEQRSRSIRRMADLALAAAEEQSSANAQPEASTPAAVSRADLDRNVDKLLYENFMREAQQAESRDQRYAALDLAGSLYSGLDGAELDTDYGTAIQLYRTLLQTSKDANERAEAYYLLAKAYDLAGDLDSSRLALDDMVKEYPDSTYYVEAQFRRGEMLFSDGDYDAASKAYSEVLKSGASSDFYEQSLYKLGWSHYKLSEYEQALERFFAIIDHLHGSAALADEGSMQSKLVGDVRRVISLSFTNLQGAESVRDWFAKRGARDYEVDIYRALGDVYLQQERFRDAADTYDMFVNVYPASPLAPEFSSLNIQAYQRGGFPTLVLPAKEKFISQYGIRSTFWEQYPHARDGYVVQLKGHIIDLARHYHALAQRSKKPEDFAAPAGWYKEYLDTPPAGDDQAAINDLYAQALYSGNRFPEAVTEFERTAYSYEGYDKAADAAFFALIAYQSQIRMLPTKTEQQQKDIDGWRDRRIASSMKFAATFPSHQQVPQVLSNVIDDQLARKDMEGAIRTAGMLVSLQPPPPEKLLVYGWSTIANGEFDLGRFKVAEFAYSNVLQYPSLNAKDRLTYQERLAASVYKQAEALQKEEQFAAAADMFMRVGQVYPDASIRKNAEFDAATLFLQIERYDSAIPILEAFRQRYPKDELNETIPDKLAVAYEKTGNFGAAALELERIAGNYQGSDKELARQALWQAAEMQDRAKQPVDSIRLYRKYLATYPQPYDFRAEGHYRLVKLYEQTGDTTAYNNGLNELLKTHQQAGDDGNDRVAWLGAWAAFTLAEPRFEEFNSIKLTQPLRRSLERKTTVMRDALKRYENIAAIGVSEYATAANFKIGQMYQVLARDMIDSERPPGLDELELEQYELLLEEQALPYEDQAIDILIANTDLVSQDIYDEWVKQSFAQLAKLLPGRFAKFEQVEEYVDIIY